MDSLSTALRRGWHAATRPLRLARRMRQMHAHLELLTERADHAEQALKDQTIQLGNLLTALRASLGQQITRELEQLRQQQTKELHFAAKVAGKLPPLEQLRLLYPWPAVRPPVPPVVRGWDGGGRDIVTRRFAERSVKVVLEIGSFLGLSARTWLAADPNVTVVCVDPWFDHYDDDSGFRHWPDVVGKNIYHLFLSSCWEYRDRIIPVRGLSPSALEVVADQGIQPDLVFIDGLHDYEAVRGDIEAAHRLFPQAILTGDDWLWTSDPKVPHAVQVAVNEFAAAKGWRVEARDNTWALDR